MKTYLVTGASGFIGSRLIKELSDSGAEVIAFTRKDIDVPNIKQIFGDFSSLEDLKQLVDYKIDTVIHLAGVTGDALEDDAMMVNVAGTSRFLRFMIDSGVKNPRVLILGVAYKMGVADVRETPVSELRNQLILSGAQVAWYDPLVPEWEGSSPVDLNWECDVAILATNQPGIDIDQIIARHTQILDCTNSVKDLEGVTTL